MAARKVKLDWHSGTWRARVRGAEPLTADAVTDLGDAVRALLGDRAWVWNFDLGQDTDWYVQLVHHYHEALGNGLLANEKGREELAIAVWALRLNNASDEDCAEICGVPVAWVRAVWDEWDATS